MKACTSKTIGIYRDSIQVINITPPKFNIDPEKCWLENHFPIGARKLFQGRTVKLLEGT